MRGAGIAFGAHGELLILGGIGTRSEALVALAKLGTLENRPPLIMLVTRELAPHLDEIRQGGAAALLFKESLSRNALRTAAASAIGLDKPSPDLPDAGNTGSFTFMRDGEQANLDIPGFRSIATISANPMAQVFFAERLYDRRRAVVKVLTASPLHDLKAIEAFCARYLFFSGLNGRNVVRYLDAGICGQWPYIALEHLASGDLRSRMQAPSPLQEQVQILSKLATALSTIHSGEFVHLDLKPENILFRENDELVLIDFNIATRFGGVGRSRDNDEVLGTPAYMSPEQGQGLPLDGRSDLYSAGVIFFEMLAGELPYLAKSDAEIIFRHIHDEIPLLPKRTRHLQVIIDGLMAKNRADRISSGAELSLALQPFLAGTVNRPPPPSGN
jgi:serine/threonine protein kinase